MLAGPARAVVVALLARLGLETFDTADDLLFLDLLCWRVGLAGNR